MEMCETLRSLLIHVSQSLMPAPLRPHGEAASSASQPSFCLSEYARDPELAGNQRCRVSRERKRNGAHEETQLELERFCETLNEVCDKIIGLANISQRDWEMKRSLLNSKERGGEFS